MQTLQRRVTDIHCCRPCSTLAACTSLNVCLAPLNFLCLCSLSSSLIHYSSASLFFRSLPSQLFSVLTPGLLAGSPLVLVSVSLGDTLLLLGVRVFFSSGDFTPNVCMRGFSSPCAGVVGLSPPTLFNFQTKKVGSSARKPWRKQHGTNAFIYLYGVALNWPWEYQMPSPPRFGF